MGGYFLSSASYNISAVVPAGKVVVTVTRNIDQGPEQPINFYEEKLALVHFEKRFAGLQNQRAE
ncbi:uncharacterized protein METZ01_LOCUS257218 [marine metagenome]|uniref:Uncharacterized protein n=1 Tax=marine metagenome TaxID=408172 RepID=A0A382IWX9_9ZZZZ